MEVLALNRLQHYVPASDEASKKGGKLINVKFLQHDPRQNGCPLNKEFINPSESGLTLDENNLKDYFGLAMAVCAVGLLRNACPCSDGSNNRFVKEAVQGRGGQEAFLPSERLAPNSVVSDKEKDTTEQSIILQTISELQVELSELKNLRSEDGKANERVVSIFASKEQEWKVERRKLREEQHKLYQELQRTFLQQEALRSQMEHLRSLQKQPCPECEHRKGLFVELKERLGEQEFLIMATMEEMQIERQEKNAISEKLAEVELSASQFQKKLSLDAEHHALELTVREDVIKQLENKAKQAENDNARILLELNACQASITTITNERDRCKERISVMSSEIDQLQVSVQGKDDIISAMFKKANADAEDRRELESELAFMKAKLNHAEREKQKWRRLVQMNVRSSSSNETFKPRSSFETRSVPVAIEDLQTLHDAEIKCLQTAYEEQGQMLQRRLSMYQERVAELEEDILLSLTKQHVARCHEHVSLINNADVVDNKCIAALHECIEAELASKRFQLSAAKTLMKQFMDSEADREQEVERWKKLYFASKATGTAVASRSANLHNLLKLDKPRLTYKLDKRLWEEIDGFGRHMRARDERMEAFRQQLLHMADEVQKTHCQLEIVKQSLATACDDRRRLEEILKQKEEEFVACHERALVAYTSCAYDNNCKEEIRHLHEKVAALQTMLMEREIEYELSLAKASSQAECELEESECKLAVAEAQLVQARMIREGERKEEEKFRSDLHRERFLLENTGFQNEARKKFQAALPRLPTGFCRAQAQASFGDVMEDDQVKELVNYSAQLSHCNPEVTSMEDSGALTFR